MAKCLGRCLRKSGGVSRQTELSARYEYLSCEAQILAFGYAFSRKTFAYWHLNFAVEELQKAGFQIVKEKEQFARTRFYDVGAIVYYLKAIPWQIPDFNVTHYFDRLLKLHNLIDKEGFFETESHRFLIIASKSE